MNEIIIQVSPHGSRDWIVYIDNSYAGTITRFPGQGDCEFSHSLDVMAGHYFADLYLAIGDLVRVYARHHDGYAAGFTAKREG